MKDTSSHGENHGLSQPVKVLAKAFLILEALQRSPGSKASLKDLAAAVKMPKPTVFRILRTLEMLGYLEYDSEAETYQVTEELGQLGRAGLGSDLQRLTRLAMSRIGAECAGVQLPSTASAAFSDARLAVKRKVTFPVRSNKVTLAS